MIATREARIAKLLNPESQAASLEARALRRRVWGLAAPVIGENFLETLLGIVDTVLVAGLGAEAHDVRGEFGDDAQDLGLVVARRDRRDHAKRDESDARDRD